MQLDFGVDVEALATGDFQLAGIAAELREDRSMNVGHIVPVFDRVEINFVRRAVSDPALESAAGFGAAARGSSASKALNATLAKPPPDRVRSSRRD